MLSCIYFTFILLKIEKNSIILKSATNAWSAQTNRVKERVFNMSCFDRFNESKTQR